MRVHKLINSKHHNAFVVLSLIFSLVSCSENPAITRPLEGWARDTAAIASTTVEEELPSSDFESQEGIDGAPAILGPLQILDDVEEVVSVFRPVERIAIDPYVNVHGRLLAVRDSRLLMEGWGLFNVDKRVKISCPLEVVSDHLLDLYDDLILPEDMPNHIGKIRQIIWNRRGCTLHDQRQGKRYRDREAETLERALNASSWDARRHAATALNEPENLVRLIEGSDDRILEAVASLKLLTLDDSVMFGLPRLRVHFSRTNRTQLYVVEGRGGLVNVEAESIELRLEFGHPTEIIHKRRFEKEFPQRVTGKTDLDIRGIDIQSSVDVIIKRAGLTTEDIVRLAHESGSSIIRASMLPHIDDEKLLFSIAFDDPDAFARRDAAAIIRSPDLLAKLMLDHPDFWVRDQTVERLTDAAVLRDVLAREQSAEILDKARERLRVLLSTSE